MRAAWCCVWPHSQTIDFLFRIAEEDFVGGAYLRLLNEVVTQAEERGPVQHLLKRGRDGVARWSTEPVSSSSSSSDLQANSAAAWGPRSSSYDMEVGRWGMQLCMRSSSVSAAPMICGEEKHHYLSCCLVCAQWRSCCPRPVQPACSAAWSTRTASCSPRRR